MSFIGFDKDAFEVFTVPDFKLRMPLLRSRITPQLRELGTDLIPVLSRLTKEQLYPHVALHMRRTVNPPEATWVAFGREKRAYKPYVHFCATIMEKETRMTCFVEDYADDKLLFADRLAETAQTLAEHCLKNPSITFYSLEGEPITADNLRGFAERMRRVKGQHAIVGITISRRKALASGDKLSKEFVKAAKLLMPFYNLGRHEE